MILDSISSFVGALLGGGIVYLDEQKTPKVTREHRRGRQMIDTSEARSQVAKYLSDSPEWISISDINHPIGFLSVHCLIAGMINSGKTLYMMMLASQLLKRAYDKKFVWFDIKGDAISFLNRYLPEERIIITNPFDARCYAWDMAADLYSPSIIQSLAMALFPHSPGPNEFFPKASRGCFEGICTALYLKQKESGYRWTLRDVTAATRSKEDFISLVKQYPETEHHALLFKDSRINDIWPTLQTYFAELGIAAALWEGRPMFSISEFVRRGHGKALVFGSKDTASGPIEKVNEIMFGRLSLAAYEEPEKKGPDLFIFIDEVNNQPKLNTLDKLISFGRSKGVSVTYAIQNHEGFYHRYSEQLAKKIISDTGTRIFLKGEYPYTQWVSEVIGKEEIEERRTNYGQSTNSGRDISHGRSSNDDVSIKESSLVLPGQVAGLPPSSPENGITGFYISPYVNGVWRHTMAGSSFVYERTEIANFIARPSNDEFLTPWTEEERELILKRKTPGIQTAPEGSCLNNQSAKDCVKETIQPTTEKRKRPFRFKR